MSRVLAIPPCDYTGTMADWIVALHTRGYNGDNYCDIMITESVYQEILTECEAEHGE